jgi:hypothetical protein
VACPVPIPIDPRAPDVVLHYEVLPVKEGPPVRLAVRMLQWVEGAPLVSDG